MRHLLSTLAHRPEPYWYTAIGCAVILVRVLGR